MATPRFEALAITGETATARVTRQHAERLCDGHFPGDPFVPGAYLVELMAEVAASLLGMPGGAPVAIDRAAFHRPVRPDDVVIVTARRRGSRAAEVEVCAGGRRAARAFLRFAAPA